jgi:cytochrome c-type biogenesis protein CcmH
MLFWILCAALTAGVIAALARPLVAPRSDDEGASPDLDVYRDQLGEIDRDVARGLLTEAEARASRVEVSRRLLAAADSIRAETSPVAAGRNHTAQLVLYAIAAGIPVLALSVYLALGSPGLPGAPAGDRMAGANAATAKVAALVAEVEARLREHPGDGRGWDVIAPVYMRLGRYADAAHAYARAIELEGETVGRLWGFAEATVAASNDVVTEPARKAFEKVLVLEPARLEPRFWLALAREQDGNLPEAASGYRALLGAMPADVPWRPLVQERLEAVSAKLVPGADEARAGPSADDIAAASGLPPDQRAAMIARMVEGLAGRLAANGNDLAGWQRLLRSYTVLGEIDKAERALTDARRALAGDGPALTELNAFARRLGLKS